jgi:uncharacterized RmlC-like cupin family protein
MRVEQSSPTSFELLTDNGCIALAGFSTATSGSAGVYFHRVALITKADAEAAFKKDLRVQAAIQALQDVKPVK